MTLSLYFSTLYFTLSIQFIREKSWRWVFQGIFKYKPEFVRNLLEQLRKKKTCWSLSWLKEWIVEQSPVLLAPPDILLSILIPNGQLRARPAGLQAHESVLLLHLTLFLRWRKWERNLAIKKASQDVFRKNITYAFWVHKSFTRGICAPKSSRCFWKCFFWIMNVFLLENSPKVNKS